MKKHFILISLIIFPCLAYSQCNYTHGKWDTTYTPMPVERFIFSAVNNNDSIYILGGGIPNGNDSEYISSVDVYVPATDSWVTGVTEIPFPMCSPNSYLIDQKIYVIGGVHLSSGAPIIYDSVFIYDIQTNSWETGQSLPTAVSVFGGDTINGKIYVAGGGTGNWGIVNNLYVYDPILDEWTEKATMNMTRRGSCAKAWNGKLYVFGGYSGSSWSVANSIEVYDPGKDEWTMLSNAPEHRTVMGMSLLEDQLLVFGGIHGYTGSTYHYSGNILRYNPATNNWFSLHNEGDYIPGMRQAPVSEVINDKTYLFGGHLDGTNHTNVWSYTLKSTQQTQLIIDTVLHSESIEIDLSEYFSTKTDEQLKYSICEGYNNELIIASIENSTLTINKLSDAVGSAELMVNAFNGKDTISSNSFTVEIEGQTSIDNIHQSSLTVYPNPASNIVKIFFNEEAAETAILKVYNSMGQMVEQFNVGGEIAKKGSFAFNVEHYNNGCYIAVFKTNNSTVVCKILIQH